MNEAVFEYKPKLKSRESILYLSEVRKALVKKYIEMFREADYDALESQIAAEWYAPGPWVTDAEIAEAEKE